VTREKLPETLSYKKSTSKMLMKFTTGINFTNILQAAFVQWCLCSFLVLAVWLCNFLSKIDARKMLVKFATGINQYQCMFYKQLFVHECFAHLYVLAV